jgi:hypothetical protein
MPRRRTSSLTTGLLALLLLAGGCAGGWQQMKTKRFTGYAQRPHDYRETLHQLEYAYAALSTFFPKAAVGPVEVLFMPPSDLIHEFGVDRPGLVLPLVPGAGRVGRRNLIVMVQGTSNDYALAMLSHLFVNKAVPGAPLWLHEGLSLYFSHTAVQAGGGQWRACFGLQSPLDLRYMQMPLDKFFAVTWRSYPETGPKFFTGTAVLLMDFIFHGDGGAHLKKIPAIFAAASQGVSGAEIMASTFPGVSLEQLGARIADFKGSQIEQRARGIMCPLPMPIAPEQVPDESAPQESPVPSQEIQQLMLALHKLPQGHRLPPWYPAEVIARGADAGR